MQQPRNERLRTAIVDATLIDGNGTPPVSHTTVLIEGSYISAIGPAGSLRLPPDSVEISATGKFVMPGMVDTNAHLTVFGTDPAAGYETLVRYSPRNEQLAIEAAQLHLKYGVTTVRDSYGVLPALKAAQEAIERGSTFGARILAAGNIVGWGGPFSVTFGAANSLGRPRAVPLAYPQLTRFQEEFNELVTQGSGEELLDMNPDELRTAIDRYLAKGPDFIKYGGTAHWSYPTLIGFSAAAQRTIVDTAHLRGLSTETHATSPEALRMAIDAGIDLIQHPEVLSPREIPDDIVQAIHDREIICSMLSNTITGAAWTRHLDEVAESERRRTSERARGAVVLETAFSRRRLHLDADVDTRLRRQNAQRLVAAGCRITVGTDNYLGAAPEFRREPKLEMQEPGLGTLLGVEGLVELGMTPSQAIVAATRNGAIACRAVDRFGTIEAGKIADLIVLDADPLENISNVRRQSLVVSRGEIVETTRLPERPIFGRSSPL
jgi:imidazolonepropionase-like amidohydrolase